jgi:hypothetical protein
MRNSPISGATEEMVDFVLEMLLFGAGASRGACFGRWDFLRYRLHAEGQVMD